MSTKFEWQTEEDSGWDAPPPIPTKTAEPRRRRWPIPLLAAFLLVGLAGLVVYWRLNRRVTAATQTIEAEVIAAHRLAQQSAAGQDLDLFAALLSTEDAAWNETQQALARQQLFPDMAPLGLWASTAVSPTISISAPHVTLSPDLTLAEVTAVQPYLIELEDGETETVWLQRTAVYRRKGESWLLSPPADDETFWGAWQNEKGQTLTLIFPARDEEIGRRLAADLDGMVGQLCRNDGLACPSGFTLQLRLDRKSEALLNLGQDYRRSPTTVARAYRMALPAPTLVGLPVDEAGYNALYRGYAGWVAAVLVSRFGVEGQDFLAGQLAQLGLRPPRPRLYHPLVAQQPPPIPWPQQDIQLLCRSNGLSTLLRYDPATEVWVGEQAGIEFASFLMPMPGDDGVLLQTQLPRDGVTLWRLLAWEDGAARILLDWDRPFSVMTWLPPTISPDGRYSPLYTYSQDEDDPFTGYYLALDLDDCDDAGCEFLYFPDGLPYWSPDGGRTLVTQYSDGPPILYLGDSAGQPVTEIGIGWGAFWLDNQTYGYIRLLQIGPDDIPVKSELVTAVLSDDTTAGEPEVILNNDDLLATLSDEQLATQSVRSRLLINHILSSPGQPDLLLVGAVALKGVEFDRQYFFTFDRRTEAIAPLPGQGDRSGLLPAITSDGRYLTLAGFQDNAWSLDVYDLERDKIYSYSAATQGFWQLIYDWSADEKWLVITEEALLRLVAPGYDYEKLVFHDHMGCDAAAWVNGD